MMGGGKRGMMRGMGGMMGGGDTPAYDTMTINGKVYPATEPLRLKTEPRLGGRRLLVTHTDGNPLAAPVAVDAIALSERCDAVVTAGRLGAWFFHCLQPGHADAGGGRTARRGWRSRIVAARPEIGEAQAPRGRVTGSYGSAAA